jgi:uncharacterized protein YndB with AHSA1/START domain
MTDTDFVYTTYLLSTPDEVWKALTDQATIKLYWGVTIDTTWDAGSTMSWEQGGVTVLDPDQVVLESSPPRRLAYTWHTFTPEFAATCGITGDRLNLVRQEPRSKVTFEIEQAGANVKLTLRHDGFEKDSIVLANVSDGWPYIIANLQTLLETGEPLPDS